MTAVVLKLGQINHKPAELSFRLLFESAPDAMVLADDQDRILLVNAQTEQLFGYRQEELVGERVEKLIESHSTSTYTKESQDGVSLELYGRRKDGSKFPVEISLSRLE